MASEEVRRRLVHAAGTGYPLLYLLGEWFGLGVGWRAVRLLLVASSAGVLVLEALRLGGYVDWAIFDRLTRDYEEKYLAGYALYIFGLTTVALLFSAQVGVPAMLMLTIGDPISGLLGSSQLIEGGWTVLVKRWWVLIAMFGVCLVLAASFVPLAAAAAGALAATLADGVKPVVRGSVIDDNLTIPIGAAAAMWLVVTTL